MLDSLIFVIGGTLAAATPLIYASMGELVVEKSGVLNLSIEGMMATGAATGFVVATVTGSSVAGFVAAACASMLLSFIFALLALGFLANQVAAGLAVGVLGLGVSVMVGKNYEGTTILPLNDVNLGILNEIPLIGPTLFSQDIMVYVGIFSVILISWMLNRSKLGRIIRAVGESPEAATAIGYPVVLIRGLAVLFGGAMAGIGGAHLTLSYTPLWAEGLVAGRGWIVVALVVFGTWRAPRIAAGAYLFGAVSLIELFVQGLGFEIPSQLLSAAPYIITIIVLAVISRNPAVIRLNHPASLGLPYLRTR